MKYDSQDSKCRLLRLTGSQLLEIHADSRGYRWGMVCIRRLMYHKVKVKDFKWTALCNVTFEVECNLVEWASRAADTSKYFRAWVPLECVRGITASNSRMSSRKPRATCQVETLHAEKAQAVEVRTWHLRAAAVEPVPLRKVRAFRRAYLVHVNSSSCCVVDIAQL